MISQEYSHQVSLARMPNWVAMYAMPPHSTQVVRRSAFLLNSSLTYTEVRERADSQTRPEDLCRESSCDNFFSDPCLQIKTYLELTAVLSDLSCIISLLR